MDLKTFISETLQQILDGVREAQGKEHGGDINAESTSSATGAHLFYAGNYGMFTRVNFDVAIAAETSGGGRGGIQVLGLGAQGGVEHGPDTPIGSRSVCRCACPTEPSHPV